MSRLTWVSLTHRTVVVLLSFLISGIGIYATISLKEEMIPSIEIPRASVLAIQVGASPEAVERDVTKPIETAVKAVTGVTKVTSKSSSGYAQISAEWDYGQNADKIKSDIRTAVDGVKSKLPSDVTTNVVAGSFDDVPVIMLAVSSDDDTLTLSQKLKNIAVPRLKGVPGVRDVTVAGEEKRQVLVTVRQADADRLGVETSTIGSYYAAANTAVPSGTLQTGTANIDVQVGDSLHSVDDVRRILLQGTDGPVELQAVADVVEATVDVTTISRVNGQRTLSLSIIKDPSGNTVRVSHGVQTAIADIKQALGSNVNVIEVFNQAPYIEESIKDLGTEGGIGLIMAVIVIMVFLWSVKPTLITAISIPISLLIALIGLWLGGNTLNILTLGALTVAIGRVVDDSIVVIENIKRHQGLGEFGRESIVRAVKEVAGAVTSSTLTTVAVFLPISLVSGQAGQLFRPFAVTVTIALLASLLVSLTLVPALASWFMRPSRKAAKAAALAGPAHEDPSKLTRLQKIYMPALTWTLAHRVITLVVAAALLGGTLALAPRLKTDFIGELGQATIQIQQDMPPGTALAETDNAAKKVETVIAAESAVVASYTSAVGGSSNQLGLVSQSDANRATFSLTLKADVKPQPVADRIKAALGKLTGIGATEVFVGRSNSQIALLIKSADQSKLNESAATVVTTLKNLGTLSNVKSDVSTAKTMLKVDVDETVLANVGMTQTSVGLAVTKAIRGIKIGTLLVGDTTMDVMLRSQALATSIDQLKAIPLPVTAKQTLEARKAAGQVVTDEQKALSDAAKAETAASYAAQEKAILDGKAAAQASLTKLTATLNSLLALLAGGATEPPGYVEPTPLQTQIAELQKTIATLNAQIASADASYQKLQDAKAKTAAAQATTERLTQAGKEAATVKATPLTLAEVASVTEVQAPASIGHVDGNRTATVTAFPIGADLGGTTTQIKNALASLQLPEGVTVTIGGVSQQQADSFSQLGLAMLVAIAVVYLIMVATFGSLLQPLILLISIPFASTGALAGLQATDTPLGLAAMIGLLMLIGIVVTNAIVLIDLINQYREEGATIDEAIREGARLRLRPIVMTALATIMALIPMGLGLTGGGVFISRPLAIVVIGGLVSSTLLTLILVPVLYDIVEKFKEKRASQRAQRRQYLAMETADGAE